MGPETRLDAVALLERVGLSSDQFGVAVVGNDAGVKLRSHSVVMPAELFALIDSMPMRRRELKQKDNDGQ